MKRITTTAIDPTPNTSYDGATGCITEWEKVGSSSKVMLGLDIDKGNATEVQIKVMARVKSLDQNKQGITYDETFDIYKVSGGTGALDEVTIAVSGDVKIALPLSVEHYEEIKVECITDANTGTKIGIYALGNWVQPVTKGKNNNL